MTIYLMGLRGSGKSTVGRLLAQRLGGIFVDLDDVTPTLLGCVSAAEALRTKGEPAFREAERRALDDPRVLAAEIVALGGGTPTHPASAHELARRTAAGATLIYLRATPATLRDRLGATDLSNRPSLTGSHPLIEIESLWLKRDPAYRTLATRVIEVDGRTDAEVVALACGAPG